MAYTAMAYGFTQHPKVMGLHDRAFRFHMCALDYCGMNLTDGHVSARAVRVVAAVVETSAKRWTQDLVAAGLWHHDVEGDGFWIHDYLKHNPSAESLKALKDTRRAAGLKGAAKRWADHKSPDKPSSTRDSKSYATEQMAEKRREEKKELSRAVTASSSEPQRPETDLSTVQTQVEQSLRRIA